MNKTVNVLLFLYTCILLFSYTTQGILPFEWVISFSPYILLVNVLLLLWIVAMVMRRKVVADALFSAWIVLLCVTTVAIGGKVVGFAIGESNKETIGKTVTLVFFNKKYGNTHYEDIDAAIQRIQPEIVGFAEIVASDVSHIKTLKTYPYSQVKRTRDQFTFGVFSRYPLEPISIENKKVVHALASRVTIHGAAYTILVLHPLPPITPLSLSERNWELIAIQDYVKSQDMKRIILVGDFNVTPWSQTYNTFIHGLPQLKNAAYGKGLYFTWGGLIRAHIDHIFVPISASVGRFKAEYVEGSDHYLIWSKIGLL